MYDMPRARENLDKWKNLDEEEDAGHRLAHRVFLEALVLTRIDRGNTEGLISDLITRFQHYGISAVTAIQVLDDVFWSLGREWGELWVALLRRYRE
jgi:hypothetical protein